MSQPAVPDPTHQLSGEFEAFLADLRSDGITQEDIVAVLQSLLETAVPSLDQLGESIERKEQHPACFAAHSLKGSFGTVGFHELAAAVGVLEKRCEEQNWKQALDEFATVRTLFESARVLVTAVLHRQIGTT